MIALHEEDPELSAATASMHEGAVSAALGLAGDPVGLGVDDDRPRRARSPATRTRGSTSSTSPRGSRSRRSARAKAAGVEISCEVTPHHLCLTDEAVRSLDARFKMNPPLRAEDDRQALIEGLRDGTIDCIAHRPRPALRRREGGPLRGGGMGVTGLETAFAALYTDLVLPGRRRPRRCSSRSWRRAPSCSTSLRRGSRPGSEANVALCDLDAEWTVGEDGYESRSRTAASPAAGCAAGC